MARDRRSPPPAPSTPAPSGTAAGDVEPVNLTDDAEGAGEDADETPTAPATGAPADDRVAALEAKIARLEGLLERSLTDPAAAARDAKEAADRARLEAWEREVSRGAQARSQDECHRRYPHGKFVWVCNLPDGNGHPELAVRADNKVDAQGRYLDVIGVTGTEHKVSVEKA